MKDFTENNEKLKQTDSFRFFRYSPDKAGCRLIIDNREFINFSSNDYLDLAQHPDLINSAIDAVKNSGCGSTASRLVTGNLCLNDRIEERLARDYRRDAALVFPTGYMANTGMIAALVDRHDTVYSDRLNHASLLDGIKLSGANSVRYRHLDCQHLETLLQQQKTGYKFVVTDTVFSMDGDLVDLARLSALCRKYDAFLIVDEAHANGVFGKNGLGICETSSTVADIGLIMGTFSKGLGSLGGFVVGDRPVIDHLINRARSLIYTTGLPPAVLAANLAALQVVRKEPERRNTLLQNAAKLRRLLQENGIDTLQSQSQIIPVVAGDNHTAVAWAQQLYRDGIIAAAIRPPTVPQGTARLRISVSAGHNDRDLELLVDSIVTAAGKKREHL